MANGGTLPMTLAFVFPGQGSQSVGMLAELGAVEPVVRATFAEASDVLGYDLWALCQDGPEADLGSTERTQPAMLAAGVATWRVWVGRGGPRPVAMAGHSLGEYTALVCSDAMDFKTAIDVVRFRGQVMQQAVPLGQGAMAAILGLEDADLDAACREAAQGEVVEPVNFNAPGQTVIAGNATAVARAIDAAKARGAKRAVLLPVSVPSHSSLMAAPPSGLRQSSRPWTCGCRTSPTSTPWTCASTPRPTASASRSRNSCSNPCAGPTPFAPCSRAEPPRSSNAGRARC